MLKGLLVGYLNAHWQNSIAAMAIFAGAAFLWDLYNINENGTDRQKLTPAQIGIYWALLVGGAAIATFERVLLRNQRAALRLWPFHEETLRELLVAALMFLALFWYNVRVNDPAGTVIEPFPTGAAISVAFVWVVAIVVELVETWTGARSMANAFQWTGLNMFGALILSALAAFDMAVFLGGWLLVLIVLGALAMFWWLSRLTALVLHRREHTA